MAFDSAVLWDGRDKIDALPSSQVPKAVQSLLLGPGSDAVANRRVADFMTGVFTDQTYDNQAKDLAADGARGGAQNLLAMSSDPARPCLYAAAFPQIPGMPTPGTPTLTPFSPITCTRIADGSPHTFGVDLFVHAPLQRKTCQARPGSACGDCTRTDAVQHGGPASAGDLDGKLLDVGSIANGGADSGRPDRIAAGAPIHCVTCHAAHNLGNNPNPNFIGKSAPTPSISLRTWCKSGHKDPLLTNVLEKAKRLPALLPASEQRSCVICRRPRGTHPGDIKTTDPGRAMVTGLIADVGKFKPPILRNLSGRLPLFHAGTASSVLELIDFYDARFAINLTRQQKYDLAKFLEAL